ncbi:MAG: ParB/RepB/Spo0J family partition protein [Bacilli bacterium]|nr:ParB/RepB/Spo0J family partition protein [Bacilli bacterium]
MKDKEKILPTTSLASLIAKFSQENIIAVMEKEYQNAPNRLIPTNLIDDTSFISSVPIRESVIDFFAKTLKEKGFYNPLVVRKKGERYELILGRKRFLAAKRIGTVSLPCVIVELEDEETLLMLLADNRDTKDVSVVQIGLVYQELQKRGYTQQTLAELSHSSRPQVTNITRILSLPQNILDDISLGKLSYGHGKVLAGLEEKEVKELVDRIHREHLSVNETEAIAMRMKKDGKPCKTPLSYPKFGITKVLEKSSSLQLSFASEEEKEAFLKLLEEGE